MASKEDWERLQEELPAIEKTGLEAWDTPEEDMVKQPKPLYLRQGRMH